MKENKIVRVALAGGLIGAVTTNPRRALERCIEQHNNEGWRCHQILPHSTANLFVAVVQLVVLLCTLGLWTFGAGYMLLFERDK